MPPNSGRSAAASRWTRMLRRQRSCSRGRSIAIARGARRSGTHDRRLPHGGASAPPARAAWRRFAYTQTFLSCAQILRACHRVAAPYCSLDLPLSTAVPPKSFISLVDGALNERNQAGVIARGLSVISADETDEASLDLDLVGTENPRFIGGISRLKRYGRPFSPKALKGRLFLHHQCNNDLS